MFHIFRTARDESSVGLIDLISLGEINLVFLIFVEFKNIVSEFALLLSV